jgi:hypothetical protein
MTIINNNRVCPKCDAYSISYGDGYCTNGHFVKDKDWISLEVFSNGYLKGINGINFDNNTGDNGFKELVSKILKVYQLVCNSHNFDYEFHYVENVLNNQNGFNELIDFLLKEYKLDNWQEKIVFQALEYDFIKPEEVNEAVTVVKYFDDENSFFDHCNKSANKLKLTLAKSSQI